MRKKLKALTTEGTETVTLPQKVLLRVSEVAQYFDVTDRTVHLWIEHGYLEIEMTPGGQKRVTKDSVDKCRFKNVRAN